MSDLTRTTRGLLRAALRFLGLFLLAGAFSVAMVDGWRSFGAGRLAFARLGEAAATLAPARVELLRAASAPFLRPPLDSAASMLAAAPVFVALALAGALALWLARKPAPLIGYSSR